MLKLARNLELPDEAVTQTFAILAKRGVGKTYTASVMVEEMLKNNLPVVVMDPIGVWWGLRSSADGKYPGLSIIIAGGDHADIPLTPDNGEVMANLIIDQKLPVVLDLSHFRKNESVKFVTDFAETLYRNNRTALHLVIDEADAFAPQRPFGNEARMLGAMEDIVRRGRARGIGVTMITQRPAVLNKNVLTQIEVLVTLRLTSPLDQKAIDEWIRTHADETQREEFMKSLPSLGVGTAWFWSPGWLDIFKKVKVRTRETLDSSSTPKVGKLQVEATNMADVDLDKIRDQLAATIEKVESDDPVVLHKRIQELEDAGSSRPEPEPIITQVEVMPTGFMDNLNETIGSVQSTLDELIALRDFCKNYSEASDTQSQFNKLPTAMPTTLEEANDPESPGYSADIKPDVPALGDYLPDEPMGSSPAEITLTKAERLILTCLAQYPSGCTVQQVAIITGYSSKGGGFRNALSSLRTMQLIEGRQDLIIKRQGLIALGKFEPLPTGQDLVQHWMRQLPLAARKILEAAVFKYPRRISTDRVAEMTGYSAAGGGFRNALSKLRTLGLIEGHGTIRASDDFFKR